MDIFRHLSGGPVDSTNFRGALGVPVFAPVFGFVDGR